MDNEKHTLDIETTNHEIVSVGGPIVGMRFLDGVLQMARTATFYEGGEAVRQEEAWENVPMIDSNG